MQESLSPGGRLTRLAREPLLQFALLGALIFALHHLWAASDPQEERRIVIDAAEVEHQQQLYEVQFGTRPDAATTDMLLDRYARDEALFREGMFLGLDTGDEVIRQRIVQKMETLLSDAEPLAEPTDADLEGLLQANLGKYGRNGRASFAQRYFAISDGDDAKAQARAVAALARLARSPHANVMSDALALGESFQDMDADEIVSRFGATQFAQAMWQAPIAQWAGPFRSGYGWHLLRVESRTAPHAPKLQDLRERVREDWMTAARERSREQHIDALREQYEVVRATAD